MMCHDQHTILLNILKQYTCLPIFQVAQVTSLAGNVRTPTASVRGPRHVLVIRAHAPSQPMGISSVSVKLVCG